jgi:hypothetical protein
MKEGQRKHPYKIGQVYLVRTVTNYFLGRLTWIGAMEMVLEDCVWVPSTGRFSHVLASGKLEEVEPYPKGPVIIGRDSVVDASEWKHPIK